MSRAVQAPSPSSQAPTRGSGLPPLGAAAVGAHNPTAVGTGAVGGSSPSSGPHQPLLAFTPEEFPPVVAPGPRQETERGGCEASRFHDIYAACVKIARRLKASGYQQCGIGAIWEIVRYEALKTTGRPYKLNNNYRAWYARTIMVREPDLAGFFAVRSIGRMPQ